MNNKTGKIIPIEIKKEIDLSNKMTKVLIKTSDKDVLNRKPISAFSAVVSNCKKTLLIASSVDLYSDLIPIISNLIQNNVRVYIILKKFDNSQFLNYFNEKNPALIREVPELENIFFIVDDVGYFFLSTSFKSHVTFFELKNDFGDNLKKIFIYYFWNKSTKEKMLNKVINNPKKAVYGDVFIQTQKIIITSDFSDITGVMIPRDSAYKSNLLKNVDLFVSEDIDEVIYYNKECFKHRNFLVYSNIFDHVGNVWKLHEVYNKDINQEFIPFELNDWSKTLKNVLPTIEQNLPDISANNILDMDSSYHTNYPDVLYSLNVVYKWKVIPPYKKNNAKKANIYSVWQSFSDNFYHNLNEIKSFFDQFNDKNKLHDLNETKNKLQKKLKEFLDINLFKNFNFNELKDFINEEYNLFINHVIQFAGEIDNPKNNVDSEIRNVRKELVNKLVSNLEKKLKKLYFPIYPLPEVGVLYETENEYFLEIEKYEDLNHALEIAEKRYVDKKCKVVAKQ